MNKRSTQLWIPIALLLTLVASFGVGLSPLVVTPAVVPASAPANEFSAERALRHSRAINRQPHPMGTAAHKEAQQYIIARLSALGLEPELQSMTMLIQESDHTDLAKAGHIENIAARIPGTNKRGAILLAARYDTVPTTPSASDAGIGAITALETMRALLAGPPLQNDVIVLFHDSEVNALFGSAAFALHHPWMKDVALAFEFNANGNAGATILAYVAPHQSQLLDHVLKAVPHPRIYSFITDLLAQNGVPDLSSFVGAESMGVDMINMIRPQIYHTMLDTPENLNPGTVQHNGSYLLALTRYFGNRSLPALRDNGTNWVAFNVLPDVVLRYPAGWALPLAVVVTAIFVFVVALNVRRAWVSVGGVFVGAAVGLVSVISALALSVIAYEGVKASNPNGSPFIIGRFYGADFYHAALVMVAVAVVAAVFAVARRVRVRALALGSLMWWVMLTWLATLTLPGFSYLFAFPLLAGLAAVMVVTRAGETTARPWETWRAIGLIASAIPAVVLFTPAIVLLFATVVKFELMPAPVMVVPLFVAALVPTALFPHLAALANERRWVVSVGALIISTLLFVAGTVSSGFSATQPRPTHIAYHLDADTGTAVWQSVNRQLDPWTAQFFVQGVHTSQLPFMLTALTDARWPGFEGPATTLDLPAPEIAVTNDSQSADVRDLTLQIRSPRAASDLRVEILVDGQIVAASVDGMAIDPKALPVVQPHRLQVIYIALPPAGIPLTLAVKSAEPITVKVTDYSHGVPVIPGLTIRPRPADVMPMPSDLLDPTSVSKSFVVSGRIHDEN